MEEVNVIIRALLKNWLMLVLLPILSMSIVYYLIKDQPQKYKTEAKLFMNLQENKAISLDDSEMKQYQILTYFQNLSQLIKAEKTINSVCLMVVEKALSDSSAFSTGNEELVKNKEAVEKRILALKNTNFKPDGSEGADTLILNFLKHHNLSYGRIAEQIEAHRIMDSDFFKFGFTEEHPEKTYLLANFIIKALIEENKKLAKSSIYSHKSLIEKLVNQAKKDLDIKTKNLENYKVNNNIINLGEYTKAIVTYLVNLEGQRGQKLTQISASEKGKSEVLSIIKNGNELSVDLTTNSEILALKEKAKALTRKKLLESFNNQNLDSLSAIEEEIENTKEDINIKLIELAKNTPYDPSRIQLDLVNRYLGYELDIETSLAMVAALEEEIDRAKKYSSQFAPIESIIGTMQQEIVTAQNIYLQLLNKLQITRSLEHGSGENVIEIIDPPFHPKSPESSKKPIIIAAAGIAIFVLFAGTIVILHLLNTSVSTVKKFEKESSLEVIAAVPTLKTLKKENLYSSSVKLVHKQQIIHLAKSIENKITDSDNVVLFLCSQKDTGKHFLAESVKKVMSSESMKIAIVDADWTMEEESEEFVDIREWLNDGNTLINGQKIVDKIEAIKKENDLVLIVTSPTNLIADYRFWTEYYSKVIYIFKSNLVWTKVDSRLQHYIQNNSSLEFIGTVLNMVNIDCMEDYIGEIPKKRNKLRIFIKKVLRRDF